MALAALIISIFALLLAGLSVYYTHRQTRVAERNEQRSNTPKFTVVAEWIDRSHVTEPISSLSSKLGKDDVHADIMPLDTTVPMRTQPFPSWSAGAFGETHLELGGFRLGESKRFRASPQSRSNRRGDESAPDVSRDRMARCLDHQVRG